MWEEIKRIFKKRDPIESPQDTEAIEIEAEGKNVDIEELYERTLQINDTCERGFEELKRIIRKQGMTIEMSGKDVIKRITERDFSADYVQHFLDIADTFFFLDSAFVSTSPEQVEARRIAWQRLDTTLKALGIEMVYKTEEVFDPSIHEAVQRITEGDAAPFVKRVINPGYIFNGNLVRTAKVVV